MREVSLQIRDVRTDGFPDEKAEPEVFFIHRGMIWTGWPLIDTDGFYPNTPEFVTPEEAKANPLEVKWESSNDSRSLTYEEVTEWFLLSDIKEKPAPNTQDKSNDTKG